MKFKGYISKDKKLTDLYLNNGLFKTCIDTIDYNNCDLTSIINTLKVLCECNEDLIDKLSTKEVICKYIINDLK